MRFGVLQRNGDVVCFRIVIRQCQGGRIQCDFRQLDVFGRDQSQIFCLGTGIESKTVSCLRVFRQNTGRGRCRCDLVSAFGLVLGNYQFIRSRRGRSAVAAFPGEVVLALTDRVVVTRFGNCPNEGFVPGFVGIRRRNHYGGQTGAFI